jgi:hypothetical protein
MYSIMTHLLLTNTQAAFSLRNEIFLCHIGCVRGCREGFSDTNKKNKLQNPLGNYETNLMILINPLLAHVGYCST